MRWVPLETLVPVLEELIEDRYREHTWEEARFDLAEKTGYSERSIDGVMTKRRKTCDFDFADKLMCALGRPDLWRVEPLVDIYLHIDLVTPPADRHAPGEPSMLERGYCSYGHELRSKKDVYVRPTGQIECILCKRRRAQQYRDRKKEARLAAA